MDRARAFYEKTLEVTLARLESPGVELWAFPARAENPGCAGALARMTGKDSGTGGTIIYFSCLDCGAVAERALQHGGRLQKEKMSIGPHGFIALTYDTEGNLFGLHSML